MLQPAGEGVILESLGPRCSTCCPHLPRAPAPSVDLSSGTRPSLRRLQSSEGCSLGAFGHREQTAESQRKLVRGRGRELDAVRSTARLTRDAG